MELKGLIWELVEAAIIILILGVIVYEGIVLLT